MSTERKILRKKCCGKAVAEMGKQCQEELLVAAEHTKREEVSTIKNVWRPSAEEVRAKCRLLVH